MGSGDAPDVIHYTSGVRGGVGRNSSNKSSRKILLCEDKIHEYYYNDIDQAKKPQSRYKTATHRAPNRISSRTVAIVIKCIIQYYIV